MSFRSRFLTAFLTRCRRRVLAHRRLLAFLLTAAAVVVGLQAARPAPPVTVEVTVAAHDLPTGAELTAADLHTVRLPPDTVPAGVEAEPVGRTLASPLRRGEPVTDLRLVGPRLTAGHPDLTAVPVRIADAGMAGLLRVGDTVDLFATDPNTARTSMVAPGALVLALPDGADADSGSGAQNRVMAAGTGRLVLVGVPPGSVRALTAAGVGGFLTYAYTQ